VWIAFSIHLVLPSTSHLPPTTTQIKALAICVRVAKQRAQKFLQVCRIIVLGGLCPVGRMCLTRIAGMPKRDYGRFSGYQAGRTGMRRVEAGAVRYNEAKAVSRYVAPRRFSSNRFYSGRGVRPGSYMRRRFSGLRKYPQAGIETKFYDTTLNLSNLVAPAASATWAGLEQNPATTLCLNAMQQGTGASNREGRKITMQSIQIEGAISCAVQADQTAADIMPVVKVWIVLDKQTNGGTASGLDSENVYTNPSTGVIGGVSPLRNMLYTKRYKVLKELEVPMTNLVPVYDGTNVEQSGAHNAFSCFIDLKGRGVEYLGNAGTVADIVDNGLFVLATASSVTYAPAITYNARLRFRG